MKKNVYYCQWVAKRKCCSFNIKAGTFGFGFIYLLYLIHIPILFTDRTFELLMRPIFCRPNSDCGCVWGICSVGRYFLFYSFWPLSRNMHERQFLNIRYIFLFLFPFFIFISILNYWKTPGKNYLHLISCNLLRQIRKEFNAFCCLNSFQIQSHKKKNNPFSDFFF